MSTVTWMELCPRCCFSYASDLPCRINRLAYVCLRSALSVAGFEVREAGDGYDALVMLARGETDFDGAQLTPAAESARPGLTSEEVTAVVTTVESLSD